VVDDPVVVPGTEFERGEVDDVGVGPSPDTGDGW
jgi:hypothetical protein